MAKVKRFLIAASSNSVPRPVYWILAGLALIGAGPVAVGVLITTPAPWGMVLSLLIYAAVLSCWYAVAWSIALVYRIGHGLLEYPPEKRVES